MEEINFGTDGWRGTIAEDYTFANVRRASQGYADLPAADTGWPARVSWSATTSDSGRIDSRRQPPR